jgi:hypothetical protein
MSQKYPRYVSKPKSTTNLPITHPQNRMTRSNKKEGETNEHLKSQQGDQQGDHD